MDLSINFDFFNNFNNFLNLYSNPNPKIKKNFFYFKQSNSKFAKSLQNTQSPNTQKIENCFKNKKNGKRINSSP